jgi:hypothetical protein
MLYQERVTLKKASITIRGGELAINFFCRKNYLIGKILSESYDRHSPTYRAYRSYDFSLSVIWLKIKFC